MTGLRSLLLSARPWQWIKNITVLAGLVFGQQAGDGGAVLDAVLATVVFCLVSSAGYIINDVLDRDRDRAHPVKCRRPIASGELSTGPALLAAFILAVAGLVLAWWLGKASDSLGQTFIVYPVAYLVLTTAYGLFLKRFVLVDVLVIALGFLLRVIAGGVVVGVEISSWLLVCTFFLATFLGFAKRRAELDWGAEDGEKMRPPLSSYNPEVLNLLISVAAASLMVCFVLYTVSDRTIAEFGTRNLFFTVPIAFYGVARVLLTVIRSGDAEDPALLFWKDRPLQIAVLAWIGVTSAIIYA